MKFDFLLFSELPKESKRRVVPAAPPAGTTHMAKHLWLKVDGEETIAHGREDEGDESDPDGRDAHHLPDGDLPVVLGPLCSHCTNNREINDISGCPALYILHTVLLILYAPPSVSRTMTYSLTPAAPTHSLTHPVACLVFVPPRVAHGLPVSRPS